MTKVPPSIAAVLQDQEPGEYELSDGTVWEKLATGQIRAKP